MAQSASNDADILVTVLADALVPGLNTATLRIRTTSDIKPYGAIYVRATAVPGS